MWFMPAIFPGLFNNQKEGNPPDWTNLVRYIGLFELFSFQSLYAETGWEGRLNFVLELG